MEHSLTPLVPWGFKQPRFDAFLEKQISYWIKIRRGKFSSARIIRRVELFVGKSYSSEKLFVGKSYSSGKVIRREKFSSQSQNFLDKVLYDIAFSKISFYKIQTPFRFLFLTIPLKNTIDTRNRHIDSSYIFLTSNASYRKHKHYCFFDWHGQLTTSTAIQRTKPTQINFQYLHAWNKITISQRIGYKQDNSPRIYLRAFILLTNTPGY